MFKEVEAQPNFIEKEENLLKWWEEHSIVAQYLQKNDASEKKFPFLDGPITANNPMGVHHAHGRTIKDFYQRYKNMQGFKQRFQNGFDCQGLWVEVEEEKDLGFNSKKDIEAYGLEKFSLACRRRVEKFSKVQTEQSKRLGMFMDWENSYYTMSENNNVHIWHFLKTVHEKGWLFKGVDSMPWCPRCGTAISQHELSDEGYKDVTHESVYIKFRLPDAEHTYLLVWTTTPWTLLANVAVAVDPALRYQEWQLEDGSHVITVHEEEITDHENKKTLNDVLGPNRTSIREWTGETLVQTFAHYDGPFDDLPAVQAARAKNPQTFHAIIPAPELVNANDGTGLVHIAPGAGKEDFELAKVHNLPVIDPIDEFGVYVEGFGDFSNRSVFDVRGDIYAVLGDNLFSKRSIFHSYPHCWRCKHELLFKTVSEWFISADEIRPLMKKAAEEATWMPDHARKRMQDWLDNMGNWPISRQRYWGLALPFYEPSSGSGQGEHKFYVVGSKEELRELALEPEKVDKLQELHRPWIDEVVLDGTKIVLDGEPQSGVWKRVLDVGDCWLDAGIVPFSTVDYLTNPEYWKEWYPFEFITEYVAQVKLWFYATLFMSVTLEGRAPWQNVLATGFLVDEKGKAMHKSAGNAIAFDDAADQAGADAIRWLYLRERVANRHGTGNLRFGYTILDEIRRRYLMILWNSYRYFVTHASINQWEPSSYAGPETVMDRWIVSRLAQTVTDVTRHLDEYNSPDAAALLEQFVVQDFSQWYVRRCRDRVAPSQDNPQDRESFFATTYYVLHTLTRVLAPFVPFIAEEMYQNLRQDNDPVSVHLTDWPQPDEAFLQLELHDQMALVRAVVEKSHALRKEAGVRLRQPLQTVTVINSPTLPEELSKIILDEINVKEIIFAQSKEANDLSVELDFNLTNELIAEGVVREVVREVQNLRRQAGYAFDDNVSLFWSAQGEASAILNQFSSDIAAKTVSTVEEGSADNPDVTSELSTERGTITLALKK